MARSFIHGYIPSRFITAGRRGLVQITVPLLFAAQIVLLPQPMGTDAYSAAVYQEPSQALRLEIGNPLEREIGGGQGHSYQVALDKGQYVSILVEQQGIDVILSLFGPDGRRVVQLDRELRKQGKEIVTQVAEVAGLYRLDVIPKHKEAEPGKYVITVTELRPATEKEQVLQQARDIHTNYLGLINTGRYDEALPLAERVLEIRENALGQDHTDIANSLNDIARLYSMKGDYEKAEPLFRRALEINEKARGSDHPDVIVAVNNLALLYRLKGEYTRAVPLFHRAITALEKAIGPTHPNLAQPINNLAVIYIDLEDLIKAEPLLQRALDIREKALAPNHPDIAQSLNNMALLYYNKGDYEKAEPFYQRALTIKENALGTGHPSVAGTLYSLATIHSDKGDYNKSEALHQRALAIREKALGTDHPDVASSLDSLATIYSIKGDYLRANPLYQRSLAIREKTLGPDHPEVAISLSNIAVSQSTNGDYGNAELLLLRALEIRTKTFGSDHPVIAQSLNNLARLHEAKGEISKAVTYQSRGCAVSERNMAINLARGAERQKLAYLAKLSEESNLAVSLHARSAPGDQSALRLAFNTVLQRKGRALDAMAEGIELLRNRANPQDQTLFDQLQTAYTQLARLTLAGPPKSNPSQYHGQVNFLKEQIEKLQSDISRNSAEFRSQSLAVTTEAVQSVIPSNAALVEIVSYRPYNPRYRPPDEAYGKARYIAYILRHGDEIAWTDLGETEPIDLAIDNWRKSLRDPKRSERDIKRLAKLVDEKVMKPVRQLLGNIRQILISPDGNLSLMPFSALVDENGRYLVENYSLSYLTSGRDLLRLQVARKEKAKPLVIADPIYGDKPDIRPSATQPTDSRNEGLLARMEFEPLLTGAEADAIKRLMPDSQVLKEDKATETAVKQVNAPRILHIATHGFFLQNQDAGAEDSRGFSLLGSQATRSGAGSDVVIGRIENPLLRSGLALAGANRGQSGDDDGILTALEVAGLNLWGTKLVVLSACDTGIGEVKNGEGVYGLRRALVLAGAESQVVSLWKVNDVATKNLMIAYYSALKQGEGRAGALRKVQLKMLGDPKRRHPYYWAGFIHSGEWANLEGQK